MDIEQSRLNMIEQQIRPWEVYDAHVLDVLQQIPREKFVPHKYYKLAFSDLEIPLPHHQCMMMPKVEARMLQSLQIMPTDEIFEIGMGSGFVTACLCKFGLHVETVDLFEDFIQTAVSKLNELNIRNFHATPFNVAHALPFEKKFDVIAITASMPEYQATFEKLLKPGGRLFVIVGEPPVMEARLIRRISENSYQTNSLFETSLPPLIDFNKRQTFML